VDEPGATRARGATIRCVADGTASTNPRRTTMANEKSRNHETGGGKGGASKHQGKPDDQKQGDDAAAGSQQDAKATSSGAGGTRGDANATPAD
jgi:hypothetical protein